MRSQTMFHSHHERASRDTKFTHAASTIATTLVSLLLTSALQADTTVSPFGFENTEGSIRGLPNSPYPTGSFDLPNGFYVQELHSSSVFPAVGPLTITSIATRPDQSVSAPVSFEWDLQLNLSTTPRESLSGTFAENYGTNSEDAPGFTTVLSRLVEAETDGVREGDTHEFDYIFDLDSPYNYDPSAGNLLVEWIIQGPLTNRSWHDIHDAPGLSLAFATNSGAMVADVLDNANAITQFTFTPEPAVKVVSPPEEKGRDSSGRSRGGPSFRGQQMYDGAHFLDLPESRRTLTSIAFRPDRSNRFTDPITGPLRITLSAIDDDTLDPGFADNLDPENTVVVFDGDITWHANEDNDPNEFDFVIPFENPFEFDPALQNLVLDFHAKDDWSQLNNWFIDRAPRPAGAMRATAGAASSSSGEYIDIIWPAEFTFIAKPWLGDANLDGEFNASDLTRVFQAAEYEDDIAMNSIWSEGDWNGDGDFDTGDLVAAFQDGGFEQGPKKEVVLVPEPSCHLLIIASLFAFAGLRRDNMLITSITKTE